MDKKCIDLYDSQYNEEGGIWNKTCCLTDGKIETYSGPGSLLKNTDNLIIELQKFIVDNNINSVIDIPCGDFNFMKHIINKDCKYLGIDISEKAINICKKYETSNIQFYVDDITDLNIKLNNADLIICKDLTIHLSFSDINSLLKNIIKSKCKYFACSRYNDGNVVNKDTINGKSGLAAREIEITKYPFNFNYKIKQVIKYKSQNLKDELVIYEMF